jgi:polyhydroxyalkanoate synthesis regulator phasin
MESKSGMTPSSHGQAVPIHGIPALTPNLPLLNTTPMSLPKSAAIDETMRNIVIDSNELLQKTAKLAEDASKVPALEQKVASLSNEKLAAQQALDGMKAKVSEKVAAFADKLVRHGSLTQDKKAGFVQAIEADPSQVVDVMEKLSTLAAPSEFGGGESPAAQNVAKSDPIAAFCGV